MSPHFANRMPARLGPMIILAVLLSVSSFSSAAQQAPVGAQAAPRVSDAPFRFSPVMFIENAGQWDERARFQVWGGPAGTMWLAEDAIWLTIVERSADDGARLRVDPLARFEPERANAERDSVPRNAANIKLSFVGANTHPRIEPFDRLDTVVSYFIGNEPEKWRPDVPVWGGVRYVDLYPGVDLEITSEGAQMVQRLSTRPGADLGAVQLRVEGADVVELDGDALRLSTAAGETAVPLLQAEGASGAVAVQLRDTQAFDVSAPFMPARVNPQPAIANPQSPTDNPADLLYGTYLGGSSSEQGYDVAVDGAGSAYVSGETNSDDFPTTTGAFDGSFGGSYDAFVIKLNPAGAGLIYATFLGGSNGDTGDAIAVDESGSAYVTGATFSSDFPTTSGAFDRSFNGDRDVFVVKLKPFGDGLGYGTYLGGSALDHSSALDVDMTGSAYVVGYTGSNTFPTTLGAFDTSYNGGYDAFVAKLDPTGSGLLYATFLGASDWDYGSAIAVGGTGSAYVTGNTCSSDFPTTAGAFDRSHNGGGAHDCADVFIVKLDSAGRGLAYATFLGGRDGDWGEGLAVDEAGCAYVTGATTSPDFPSTPGAFDRSYGGGSWAFDTDAFVVKLNPVGSGLAYATFLGASDNDWGDDLAVDEAGHAYVTGGTWSSDFPTSADAFDRSLNRGHDFEDAFVVNVDPTGGGLAYATFLGGSEEECISYEAGCAIAVDGAGRAYVTGRTGSNDFPTTPGTFDRSYNGDWDVFVVKLAMGQSGYTISGRVIDAGGHGIPGVTVWAGFPRNTTTDGTGNYTFTELPAGMYNITPSKDPYAFSPASLPVTVPPDATGQDFTQMTITDVEVNQVLGIQLNGEENFAAGKETAVRVLLTAPVEVDPAKQWVTFTRDGTSVTTLYPAERAGTETDNLTFLCPSLKACGDWQAGFYVLNATVNGITASETTRFDPRNKMRVLAVPVKVTDRGEIKHLPDNQWKEGWKFLAQVYPIAQDSLNWQLYPYELDGTKYDLTQQGECSSDKLLIGCTGRTGLLAELYWLQPKTCLLVPTLPGCYDKIIGFIPPMALRCDEYPGHKCGCLEGQALTDRGATMVMANGVYAKTCSWPEQRTVNTMQSAVAHEVGHTYGLGDEYDVAGVSYKCDVNPPPPTYPTAAQPGQCPESHEKAWPDPQSGTGSLISTTDAHPYELLTTLPDRGPRGVLPDLLSFMGNPNLQRDAWVTPRSYHHLFAQFDPARADAAAQTPNDAQEAVWISGWISKDGGLLLAPSYRFAGATPSMTTGRYKVEALDAISRTLATQYFDVSFTDFANPPAPLNQAPFSVVVPLPAGTTALRIWDGGTVLKDMPISLNSPEVAVTTPGAGLTVAGPQTVTWQASDADGDQLYYSVQYSHNGDDQLTLAANITATQLLVNFDALPGGSQARIQVWVTDGINTAEATTGPFTVAPKPPAVFIVSPAEGGVYLPGSTVTLSGSAYDPQDGWLRSTTAMIWYSDRDGLVGSGEAVHLKTLSQGPHTITLRATNGAGLTDTRSVHVYIGAKLYLPVIVR